MFVFCFCFLKFSTWAKLNTLAGLYGPPGRMFDTPPGLTASSLVAMHAALLTINILVVFKAQSLQRNSSRPCRGRRPGFVQLGHHSHLLCGGRGGRRVWVGIICPALCLTSPLSNWQQGKAQCLPWCVVASCSDSPRTEVESQEHSCRCVRAQAHTHTRTHMCPPWLPPPPSSCGAWAPLRTADEAAVLPSRLRLLTES